MLAGRSKALRAALVVTLGLASVAAGGPAATAVGDDGTVRLSIVVPLVVPESAAGFISSEELEAYTRPLGVLTRQLDAVIDRPVTIAIDPRIIASIRVLGTSAPASATEWLARLSAASNDTFALTYGDSDITLATQAGSPQVLAPESFDFAIDPALFVEAVDEAATPAPTPAPTLPTSESLVEWPYSLDNIAWPRDDTVIATDLETITGSGYSATILSAANVARTGDGPLVSVAGVTAPVSDDAVSDALRAAAASVTPEDWQAALSVLNATIQGAPGVVLATLDRSVPLNGTRLADTLSALQSNPVVQFVSLSDVLAGSASEATLSDWPQDPDRVAQTARLLEAAAAEARFASIVESPEAITAPQQLGLLALLSTGWSHNPEGWVTATEDFLTDSEELRNSVQVVASSSFNLLADSASLPISVSNALDQAVTVYITVRPETALLAVTDSRVEIVVEPNSQAKGEVPVQAISNGEVQVLITLSSATNIPVGSPTTAAINVQAGWETPIVLVIAALVVVVFAVGIVRNILRRRTPVATPDGADD